MQARENILFYSALVGAVLLSDPALMRGLVAFGSGNASFSQITNYVVIKGFTEQVSIIVGNAFNYIGVFFWLILNKKKDPTIQNWSRWLSLFACFVFYVNSMWSLWLPIIEGGRMSSTFPIVFLWITAYCVGVSLLSGWLGRAIGKKINASNSLK